MEKKYESMKSIFSSLFYFISRTKTKFQGQIQEMIIFTKWTQSAIAYFKLRIFQSAISYFKLRIFHY